MEEEEGRFSEVRDHPESTALRNEMVSLGYALSLTKKGRKDLYEAEVAEEGVFEVWEEIWQL